MDVTTDRTHSDGSASGHLPSVAIRPQDRVHVEIRHLAPKRQVGVRDHQECSCRRSRSYGLSSRAHRLLQVPDGRRNHCRPQTSIATPFLRRLLLSPHYLSLMAHVSTLRQEQWRHGLPCKSTDGTAPQGQLRQRRSLDAIGMSRAALGRYDGASVATAGRPQTEDWEHKLSTPASGSHRQ